MPNLADTVAPAAPEYFNDPVMQRIVRLVAYMTPDRSDRPSVATGFIMERDGERFLISNYHVFTGLSPERRFLGHHPKVPAVIEIWNFGVPVADVYVGTDYLVHPDLRNSLCDIAAYNLSKAKDPEKGEPHQNFGRIFNRRVNALKLIAPLDAPYCAEDGVEMHRFVGDAFVPISRDATVFGYPGGIDFDSYAVGVNTKIASSFYSPLPYFLVSGTTYKGCSGGPVVARSIGGYLALKLARQEEFRRGWASSYRVCHEEATVPIVDQLIGIYSGRLLNLAEMNETGNEEGAGFIGKVWHWRLVKELLEMGIPDSTLGI